MGIDGKRLFLNFFGCYYIILGMLAVFASYMSQQVDQIYWFCYLSVFLFGVGMLKKDAFLISSQFNIVAIGMLVWSLDFLYVAAFNTTLLGITDYFFIEGNHLGKFISLQHLYTVPLMLYSLSILKIDRFDSWKASLAQIFILFAVTYAFTSPDSNVNCVFESCIPSFQIPSYYQFTWLALTGYMVFATNYIVARIFRTKDRHSS